MVLITIGFLVFLEGLLSFDNAIALAVVARHLPPEQQKKALRIGIWCAFLFRAISLFFLAFLMSSIWIKIAGGLYLLYLAGKHFFFSGADDDAPKENTAWRFWTVVFHVELLDIAFSTDSIMSAVGVADSYWIVLTGGILGIIMMRFAAGLFIGLLDKYPHLERTAYLLVATIGAKLVAEGCHVDTHAPVARWMIYAAFTLSVMTGFQKAGTSASSPVASSISN